MKTLIGFFAAAFVGIVLLAHPKPAMAGEAGDVEALMQACEASGGSHDAAVDRWYVHGCMCPEPSSPPVAFCEAGAGNDSALKQEADKALGMGLLHGDANLTILGIEGEILNGLLSGPSPEEQAAAAAEAHRRAMARQQQIEAARRSEVARQAAEEKRLNEAKKRILDHLKDAAGTGGELTLKHDDGTPLVVTAMRETGGDTVVVPGAVSSPMMVGGMTLKRDGMEESTSAAARSGLDTSGPLYGAKLDDPRPAPAGVRLEDGTVPQDAKAEIAKLTKEQRTRLTTALQADMKTVDAAEQPLKTQLAELQKDPAHSDPVAVLVVKQQIAMKEDDKKQIQKKLDLTASDDGDDGAVASTTKPAAPAPKGQP